jgi:hypothetical protein
MKKIDKNTNFLELIPNKKFDSEKKEDGKIQIVIPRFKNRMMRKIALNLGRSEFLKVSLDDVGSKVWELIDGSRTVGKIGQILQTETKTENGETMPQVYERLTKYFVSLSHHRFIDFKVN